MDRNLAEKQRHRFRGNRPVLPVKKHGKGLQRKGNPSSGIGFFAELCYYRENPIYRAL
ncbi:hypothetical protein D3C81_2199870 [compost metagenome]